MNKKYKIVTVSQSIPNPSTGGGGNWAASLMHELSKKNYELTHIAVIGKHAIIKIKESDKLWLKKLGIKNKFKVIIDGNLTSKSKPHPEVFLKGAKMLGVNPKEVIVFEDSIAGVKAANKAKMVSVAICKCGKIENAKYNFNSLDDIPLEFFEKMI